MKEPIKGQFISVVSDEQGESKTGKEWRKVRILVEQGGQYPKKVVLDAIDSSVIEVIYNLKPSEQIEALVNAESREYNGKWYTNLTAWRISI